MRKLLTITLLCTGCSGMNNTDKGMLAGGLLGAGAGTVIGGHNGNAGAGAAIGAASGALLGGLVGNQEDKAERRAAAAQAQALQYPPLAVTDVVRLAQQHISDDIIIQQIRTTGSVYQLSPNEIGYLKSQGVSDRVVMEMQSRRTAPVQQAVYVVEQPPPVRVGVGFGYGWPYRHHHYRCW